MYDLIFNLLSEISSKSLNRNSCAQNRSFSGRSAVFIARLTAFFVVPFVLLGGTFLRAQSAKFLRAQITVANNANNGLQGPVSIAFDAQGNLYISDWSGAVYKESPPGIGFGGFTQSVVVNGLAQPNGVVVDGQGNVYVADPTNARVLKETPSGGAYTQTVLFTKANNGIDEPAGIAIDLNGNLYIADFGGDAVYKETLSAGTYTQTTIATYSANGLFEPAGVAVDANGNVYIADTGNSRVLKESYSSGSYVQNVLASGLNFPFGVSVDSNGNVYISDTRNNRVLKEALSNGSYVQSVLPIAVSAPHATAVDANGNLYIADAGNNRVIEEKSSQVDFGPVSVDATSSTSIALTFQFSASVTLNTKIPYQILTMGAPGQDFADAGSPTCTAGTAFSSGNTCVVNVTFSPKLAGTRNGAVILVDSSGNEQGTAYISGTGQAPQIGFTAAAQTVIGPCCAMWPAGVAVDGSGNVYLSDQSGNQIVKETPTYGAYTQSVVANATTNGLSQPDGVAVDGAGNVYVTDPYNERVLKMTPASSGYTATTVTSNCHLCHGVAVDGTGNVYVADSWNLRVLKETLVNGIYSETVIANSTNNGIGAPYGIAVDGNGNVYVADTYSDSNYQVFKETLGSGGTYTQSVVADAASNGLDEPYALAVDGVGNLYIADKMNYRILRETLLTDGKYEQIDVAGATEPQGVAVDGSGNLYFSDPYNKRALLLAMGSTPALDFGTVAYGNKSTVNSIQVVNNGNETLNAVSPGIVIPPGWVQVTGSGTPTDCTPAFTLAEGAECNLSLQLSPLSGEFGSLVGGLGLTDNSLNKSPGTQAIELTGTAVKGTPVITWAPPTAIPQGTALSATQLNATASLPGTFVYTPAAGAVLAPGQQTLSVSFTPTDVTDYSTATATVTLVVYPPEQLAANAAWVWMGGSNALIAQSNQRYGVQGVYGSPGVAAPANVPGGRSETGSWTDKQGNFWLFGGWGYDSVGTEGELNDLWEFSPPTQEWTWASGSSTMTINSSAGTNGQSGVYGTINTPASTNVPGGRDSASTWIDSSGNLWLFGGEGIDSQGNYSSYLNDLWEYTPGKGEWTWRGGNSVACTTVPDEGTTCGYKGTYGTLGKAAAGNYPGSRVSASSWTDGTGNLWLFGGYGLDSAGTSGGELNDLWEYSPSTGQWAWMAGSNTAGSPGTYTTSTDSSAPLVPSARNYATSWTDSNGNLWLFGGEGFDSTGTQGILNDLWEFVPSSGLWAWVSGSSTLPAGVGDQPPGQPGVYGSLNTPASSNTPGGRWGAVGRVNENGHLALYGGQGFDSGDTLGDLNDVWVFNPSLGEWVWKGGYSTVVSESSGWPGVYGLLGVPAATNAPGGRYGASGWTDSGGNHWIFGGFGADSTGTVGSLNDLWAVGTPAAQPTFNPLPGTYLQSESVTINDTTPNAIIYYTTDGSAPTINSTKYTSAILVSQTETINAIAIASGYITSPVASGTYTISPPKLVITWPTPSPITYGTALSATQLDATANVAGSFVYSPAAGTVLTVGNQTLSATFTPTDTTDYKVTTVTVSLTVNPATPSITWPTPSPITYGTALSATQLDATANTAGAFAYSPTAGTVLGAGKQTLSTTFTPSDATDYTTAKASVTLTVNQATPTITWTKPSPITYGTALSATQLDATASVAGSFAYSPGAGTVLSAGSQTLTATFTPSDSTDYTTAKASVSLTVNQATPTISWPTPAAITYGTPLSAAQLNATASVPGSFAYSPATGTVLKAGTQALAATFTPTDATDYTTAKASVQLTVNKAVLTVTAANLTKVYGAALPALTYTISGFVNGDTAVNAVTGTAGLSTTATAQSGVGSYPVTVSLGSLAASNYTFTLVPGILAVTPATLIVTAANASVLYGQPMPICQYTIAGFVNGDTSSVVTGTAIVTTQAQQFWAPGNYPIIFVRQNLAATNYSFVYVNGTLTIRPLGRTIAPKFSPKPGISVSSRTVTITDKMPRAMIFYALHGDTPTMASHRYVKPIEIHSTETIKAIAVVKGYSESEVVTATYTIE
jgi:DNA-binding beta-propeller fold protein YncE/N-acetylneuraminic acid mutarotase